MNPDLLANLLQHPLYSGMAQIQQPSPYQAPAPSGAQAKLLARVLQQSGNQPVSNTIPGTNTTYAQGLQQGLTPL